MITLDCLTHPPRHSPLDLSTSKKDEYEYDFSNVVSMRTLKIITCHSKLGFYLPTNRNCHKSLVDGKQPVSASVLTKIKSG